MPVTSSALQQVARSYGDAQPVYSRRRRCRSGTEQNAKLGITRSKSIDGKLTAHQ